MLKRMSNPPHQLFSKKPTACLFRIATSLFDHLIGKGQQGWRNLKAGALGGLQIQHEKVPGRLLEWQIGRVRTPEDAIDQRRGALK